MTLTYIFIGITVAISLYAWNNANIMNKWIMNPYSVQKYREYYRFLTSGFLHADYGHLFFNMYSLYLFGPFLESYFIGYFGENTGLIYYCILFLGGIIVANIPDFIKNQNNSSYNALGASGGVSSVIFAAILFQPVGGTIMFMPPFVYAIVYSVYSIYMAKRNIDNIGHTAHLAGAAFGIIFTLILEPSLFSSCIAKIMAEYHIG